MNTVDNFLRKKITMKSQPENDWIQRQNLEGTQDGPVIEMQISTGKTRNSKKKKQLDELTSDIIINFFSVKASSKENYSKRWT